MILSDKTIKQLIQDKKLVLENLKEGSIQANAVDLSLGKEFLFLKHWDTDGILDLSQADKHKHEKISKNEMIIPPHSFVLASTEEYIHLPTDISAFIEGKSSIGRMGLFIQNASVVAPGFKGNITLELYNANILPIRLNAGIKICQIIFFKMDSSVDTPYSGKYQNQKKATAPKS